MHIIEVIPLTMLPPNVPQILSYFFNSELSKGAIVEIPLNKRKVPAVVISSSSLEKEKLALKKIDFQIKKLTRVIFENPKVSDYQLKLAVWIARHYYSPLGYTLKTILPRFTLKKKFQLPASQAGNPQVIRKNSLQISQAGNPQLWIYKTKRLADCLELKIKEIINRSIPPSLKSYGEAKQVLIVVSEKASINYFLECFSKKYKTAVIFSDLSNEKIYDAWEKAWSGDADIIIGTRQALNMHFKDLGLIIIDDPLHEFYKSDMVPRYNAVALAHKVAELNNSQLVLTSVIPGVENHYKVKNGLYELKNIEPKPKVNIEIINMAQELKNANWSPVSKNLKEKLIACLKSGKRVLLFSSRRGYAGIFICENCGSSVKCPQCEVSMRTHRSIYIILACHHCGISKPLPEKCSVCGKHNMKTVGPAGTQKIYDSIKTMLANAGVKTTVLALDTDIVKNETEEEEIVSEIAKSKSSVLIATQMVFSHRFYLSFDLIAIINADALTNMPDFKSEENLFYQIEKLLNFEPDELFIQTYNPDNGIMKIAAQGDYEKFYDNELKLRLALSYPPFFKLVKLTFRHNVKEKASNAAKITTEKLKMAVARFNSEDEIKIIEAVPAHIEREKGLYVYNIFLKVRDNYQNIGELLKYAGPGWIIDVEPRSLL